MIVPTTSQPLSNTDHKLMLVEHMFGGLIIDWSWTSPSQFSGCKWVWNDISGQIQLMGTRNIKQRESALHSEVGQWNGR